MGIFDASLASTPSSVQTVGPNQQLQPYTQDVLAKGQALLDAGTPAYTGQMTAGPSDLQQQAWSGLAGLTLPTAMTEAGTRLGNISEQAAGTKFDPSQINQYMNPYIQQALNPQLEEMRRQSQINLQPMMAKLTQAGGYGGGRQAILQSEANRNLLAEQNKTVGQGYKDAYDSAMKAAQYASELGLKGLSTAATASQAQGNVGAQQAQYGLQNLQAMATAGKTQQEQDQAALNAQYNEWLRQLKYTPEMLKMQQQLIQGMPGGSETKTFNAKPSPFQQFVGSTAGIAGIVKNMKEAGVTSEGIAAALRSIGLSPSGVETGTEISNTANPGQEGYGWRYFSDGTVIDPNGNYYRDGQVIWSPNQNTDTDESGNYNNFNPDEIYNYNNFIPSEPPPEE